MWKSISNLLLLTKQENHGFKEVFLQHTSLQSCLLKCLVCLLCESQKGLGMIEESKDRLGQYENHEVVSEMLMRVTGESQDFISNWSTVKMFLCIWHCKESRNVLQYFTFIVSKSVSPPLFISYVVKTVKAFSRKRKSDDISNSVNGPSKT